MEYEAILTLVLDESEDPEQQTESLARFAQAVELRCGQLVAAQMYGYVMTVPVNVKVSEDLLPATQTWTAAKRAVAIFEDVCINVALPHWKVAGIEVLTEAESDRRFQLRDAVLGATQ